MKSPLTNKPRNLTYSVGLSMLALDSTICRPHRGRNVIMETVQKDFEVSLICEILNVTHQFVEKVRKSMKEP